MSKWYYNLNERIYNNCKMYYENYRKLDEITDEQLGIMGGLYQSLNIVANDYIMNKGYDNRKYRKLLDEIENFLEIG